MTIDDVVHRVGGEIRCCHHRISDPVERAFCSDLMSDVLTLGFDRILLITGLVNVQAIRTAEMADISHILFVRGKEVSNEMIELAIENDIILVQSKFSMFKVAGELFSAGIQPVY